MINIKVGLDWIPNMTHSGIIYADILGMFSESEISISLVSPEEDNYLLGNETKLATGNVDLAILPIESVIDWNDNKRDKLIPIATLMQANNAAIFTLKSNRIKSPADLAGMRYGSLDLPYEVNMLRSMMAADGCESPPFVCCPERLSLWDQFLEGKLDAIWAFSAIEGIEAQLKGIEIQTFWFEDYGIPYPGTSFLVATKSWLLNNQNVADSFLEVLSKAYKLCVAEPEKVAKTIVESNKHSYTNNYEFNLNCLKALIPYFLNQEGEWGKICEARFNAYLKWLNKQGLINNPIEAEQIISPCV